MCLPLRVGGVEFKGQSQRRGHRLRINRGSQRSNPELTKYRQVVESQTRVNHPENHKKHKMRAFSWVNSLWKICPGFAFVLLHAGQKELIRGAITKALMSKLHWGSHQEAAVGRAAGIFCSNHNRARSHPSFTLQMYFSSQAYWRWTF